MKNKTILILLGVLLLIQFVSAKTYTLTDTQPTIEVNVNDKVYTVELVSASDVSATIKVTNSEGKSEIKEISSEGSSKNIGGLDITLKNADETNLALSAVLIIEATMSINDLIVNKAIQCMEDSDGGKNYYVKGSIDENNSYTDKCTYCTGLCPDEGPCPTPTCGALIEYYCENNEVKQEIKDCECNDGKCLSNNNENGNDGNYFKLTDTEPSIGYGESYKIELVSATDNSANLQFSQVIEISEGNSREILGVNIRIDNAEETNLNILADIIIDEEDNNGQTFYFSLFYYKAPGSVKDKVAVNGVIYDLELISVTDGRATIKVTDPSGKTETKEIGEDNPAVQVNGIMISVNRTVDTNLEISARILVENGRMVLSLTNANPEKVVAVNEEKYSVELLSATDSSANIRVSQIKEISEGSTKKVGGLDITLKNADETNLRLSATISISKPTKEVEVNPTEETGPVEIPKPEDKEEITDEEKEAICNGCVSEDKCYPFGYRKSGEFCSENKEITSQLDSGAKCENNFECNSNLCVSGECVSEGLIKKIINWFKRLFGLD